MHAVWDRDKVLFPQENENYLPKFKYITIYNNGSYTCNSLYHMMYQPSTNISPLVFGPRADI